MAKISARGATEVARQRITNTTYVLCSDGRVLRKLHYTDGTASGYTVVRRGCDLATFERLADNTRRRREGVR